MNIYEKIQAVRVDLENEQIKMTGHNEFARYDYFELDDFIKPLNALMHKYKMTAYPSFTPELATLTAVNCEQPEEKVTVTSPMGAANLKGCHEVQNIGATETYQRRYLYQALFDITEKDSLNATQGKSDKEPARRANASNNADFAPKKGTRQLQIENIIKGTEFTLAKVDVWIEKKYGKVMTLDELSEQQFADLFNALLAAVKKGKADGNG